MKQRLILFWISAAAVFLASLLAGCGTIYHTRVVIDPKTKEVVAIEKEGARALLWKSVIDKLRASTKDGTYQHTFSASGVEMSGDSEMAKTLIESTGTAIGNAGGKGVHAAVTGN